MPCMMRCTEELQSCARSELTVSGIAAIYTLDPETLSLSIPVKSVIIILGLESSNLPRGCFIQFLPVRRGRAIQYAEISALKRRVSSITIIDVMRSTKK